MLYDNKLDRKQKRHSPSLSVYRYANLMRHLHMRKYAAQIWANTRHTCRRKVDFPQPFRPAISRICPGRTAPRKNTPVGAGSVYVRAKSWRAVSSGFAKSVKLPIKYMKILGVLWSTSTCLSSEALRVTSCAHWWPRKCLCLHLHARCFSTRIFKQSKVNCSANKRLKVWLKR